MVRTSELGFVIRKQVGDTLSILSESAVVNGMQCAMRPLSIVIPSMSRRKT